MQDTDSVFFYCEGATLAQAEAIGKQIAASVTAELRVPGGDKPYIQLAYEKTMMPALFLGKKFYIYQKSLIAKLYAL